MISIYVNINECNHKTVVLNSTLLQINLNDMFGNNFNRGAKLSLFEFIRICNTLI